MSNPQAGSSSERMRGWFRRADIRGVVLIWALLTTGLIFFSFVPARIMGPPASPTMHAVETTMTVFTIAASPVAALVWAIAIYSLISWRRRRQGTVPPEDDGPAIRSNKPASSMWLIVSSALCVFLLVWGLAEMEAVNAPAQAASPLEVDVTGQQWVWTFSYPDNGNIQSDQLYLPINRPVVFHVTSLDVLHSFWVVQFGIKVDANPGETTETSVVPDRLGTFDVRCAELCGLLHSDMETSAHVLTRSGYDSWVTAHGGQA
jgi:cytochrome c oxidase subunit 2